MKSTLLKSIFVLVLLFSVQVPAFADAPARPNVVLFLVDDMGWMDSSVYGSQYYETPNMERLAKQSMRFTNAYAVPLCSPTRASILSGQYSARHGITSAAGHQPPQSGGPHYSTKTSPNKKFIYPESKRYLDPKLITLAEVLRDAGYRTGHFGKWHLGVMPQHWPDKQGFETIWHCAPDPGPPNYFSPYGVHAEGHPTARHKVGNITDGPEGEHISDRLTDEALRFIEKNHKQPFYLNFWHYSVHGPWQHKEQYTARYAQKKDPRSEQRNPVMASMLQNVDESLGRVLDKLEELNLTDKTLFIFYSDNGGNTHSWRADDPKLRNVTPKHPKYETIQSYRKWAGPEAPTNNAPLREGKGRIYEGGQRVPLMVRWPKRIEAGSLTDTVVGPIDMYPTILEAVQVEQPGQHILDGVSFLPVLLQQGTLDRKAFFTWFPHLIPAVSVRAGDYKLIRRWESHPNYPDLYELYNLKEDIGETTNLAAKMPGKVKELDALIEDFIERTGALAPKPNPDFKPRLKIPTRGPSFGLVPKMCKLTLVKGAARIEADGRTPFLGTAQVKLPGPLTLKLRIRSTAGGTGKVQWKTAAQKTFSRTGQSVEYSFKGGQQWQDVTLQLPIQGNPGIVRLYLPATASPVEIQTIRFTGKGSGEKSWSFERVQP
ncbi:sulfatase [uncultured Gimesia sp.]|uniref:sulfatase n=1 Tax=uncultured Gimesia sp. TaxID=1678688 RepID=UPI0030D8E47E|tara:strand:- start:329212 stop:331182 length:1971 start_codon:yes stop_codon:yes gene_type:complete